MLQLRAGQPSKYKNKTKPKQNLGSLRGFGKVKQSSEWQMIIKSCKSAVLEKMQTGFRVKKPGWQLSSSTDDLTLVYGLCWGYSLPEVILFTGWAFSQWNRLLPGKRGPVLLWWLLVASVAPEWLPASYPSSPNTWVLSAETAQLLSLRIFLSGWFPSFRSLHARNVILDSPSACGTDLGFWFLVGEVFSFVILGYYKPSCCLYGLLGRVS